MSSFVSKAKRPGGTEYEDVWYLDDYYGRRRYGVKFPDGKFYPAEECEELAEEWFMLRNEKREVVPEYIATDVKRSRGDDPIHIIRVDRTKNDIAEMKRCETCRKFVCGESQQCSYC